MSSNRRFEYEKGPRLEDERSTDESESDENECDERDGPVGPLAAAVAGLVAGAVAFATLLATVYQIAASMDAAGIFGGADGPGRWVMTRLIAMANHGVPLEVGGEAATTAATFRFTSVFVSPITALLPAVVLIAAGYLLVRHVHLETRPNTGLAVGSLVASYVVLAVVVARTTEWTPEGDNVEEISVAIDAGAVLSLTGTVVVFVAVGVALATLPRILEAAPFDLARDVD